MNFVRRFPRTTILIAAAITTRVILAWHSGLSPYQGFNEAFYALGAQQLQTDLIPRINGTPHWNTPPLYVWLLDAWGTMFGWSELSIRIPSLIAWVSTAPAIARIHNHYHDSKNAHLSVLLWFILPFPFLWSGRAQTDMVLTCFLAWGLSLALKQQNKPLSIVSGFSLLTKQVALLPVALFLRRPRTVIAYLSLPVVFGVLFYVWGEQPNFIAHQGQHFGLRGLGFWQFKELLSHGVLIGTAFLPFLLHTTPKPSRLWGFVALFLLFTLYAAPPGHTYYFLPAFIALPVVLSPAISTPWRLKLGVFFCVLFSGYTVWDSGDLWDTRIRDATNEYGPMDGVDTGLWAHHQYYTGQNTAHLQTGNTTTGLNLVYTYPSSCVLLETYGGLLGLHRPLFVVECQ